MSASLKRWPAPAASGSSQTFILQRSGGRPLRFDGVVVACSHDSCGAPAWARLRLALYRRCDGGYVCEMVGVPELFRAQGGAAKPVWCHAAAVASLEAALCEFETMAASASDMAPTAWPMDAAAALFHAAGRLWRESAQDRALRHAAGQFLYRVCIDMAT
jgi:hypothetical protein